MKLAICAQGEGMAAQTDPRFGRCRYFVVVDLASGAVETLENPNCQSAGGAGIQTAQMLADMAVEAVVVGNLGPNAARTLGAAGIQINQGLRPTVAETVQAYRRGELKQDGDATVDAKFGMRMGGGRGGGQGRGRGRW
ncbi:MAG TPA: dinitrogenase iron-molybdenum cofactor biosynthesis protein [Firmicutes bacterium]|jgi:predicted Fe-Mo cluster-binding NifX family protein|nr:dinitrogenase iron-molybdenum cofactor biosynthesis protein [Bacillota bacterium]